MNDMKGSNPQIERIVAYSPSEFSSREIALLSHIDELTTALEDALTLLDDTRYHTDQSGLQVKNEIRAILDTALHEVWEITEIGDRRIMTPKGNNGS